jgi:cytochrome c553
MMKTALVFATVSALLACGGALAGNPVAGQAKSKTCAACHGADGNSAAPDFPRLAGQREDYLVKAMKDYKSGARKNSIMAPLATKLSVRDMEDLAAYYARQLGLTLKY